MKRANWRASASLSWWTWTMRCKVSALRRVKGMVVELKFFGGLEANEIAEVLDVSEKTVLRDWNFAKLWLRRELTGKCP